jgi:hypothetical protein
MKMGRRRRCSSVTYQFRYAPSSRPAKAGPAAYFDRNESHAIYGTGHQFNEDFETSRPPLKSLPTVESGWDVSFSGGPWLLFAGCVPG